MSLNEEIDSVLEMLKKGKFTEIEGERCIVVLRPNFVMIVDFLRTWDNTVSTNPRIEASGYENALISLSSSDTHRYYVACMSEPVLDTLWSEKAPKTKAEAV